MLLDANIFAANGSRGLAVCEGMDMKPRVFAVTLLFAAAALLVAGLRLTAAESPAAALTGAISSQDEPRMEGVVVSAKRAGLTITTSVVSDAQGRYSFPRNRLEPGSYTVRIRATGYELESAGTA